MFLHHVAEFGEVVLWLTLAFGILWKLRSFLQKILIFASELASPITVLVIAAIIYSTPQMRDVLLLHYQEAVRIHPIRDVWAVFGTHFGAGSSIMILTTAIGVWGPARSYNVFQIIERTVIGVIGVANKNINWKGTLKKFIKEIVIGSSQNTMWSLLAGKRDIRNILIHVYMFALSTRNVIASWLIAFLFPALIYYNIVTAKAPDTSFFVVVLYCSAFYIASVIFVAFVFVLYVVAIMLAQALTKFGLLVGVLRWYTGNITDYALIVEILFIFYVVTAVLAFCLLFVAPIAFLLFDFNFISLFKDDIVIVNIFLAAALSFFTLLAALAREKGLKGAPAILGIVAVLAFCDWDDNHALHPSGQANTSEASQEKNLATEFSAWMSSRPDRHQFSDSEYPVYIVAAEGGGIYAAYHAALFLSEAQDRYPDFAKHVFAISAVSGGSLGASVFASLVNAQPAAMSGPEPKKWFSTSAQKLLERDFLSELAAATLFLDMPGRLLPCWPLFCPGQRLSRARGLERSIEQTWFETSISASGGNPFKSTIEDLWDPKKNTPALLLNTTEVESGFRVVIAPMHLKDEASPGLFSLTDRVANLKIPLSEAITLSASFPWLTPAGSYHSDDGNAKRRLVDGGYFENSGVATALDIISRLKALQPAEAPKVKFILLSLVSSFPEDRIDTSDHSFGELATPLRALVNTRAARGRLAVAQAHLYLDRQLCPDLPTEGHLDCVFKGHMRRITLATGNVQVPLGWVLSKQSRRAIECSIGLAGACDTLSTTGKPSEAERFALNARWHNNQVLSSIGQDLHYSP